MAKWHNQAIASRTRPLTTEHRRLTHLTTRLSLRQASDSNPKDDTPAPSAPTSKLPRSKSQASRIASQQIQDLQTPSQLTRQVPRAPTEESKVREVIRRTPAASKPNARVASKPTTTRHVGGSSGRDGQSPLIKYANFQPREQLKGEMPASRVLDEDNPATQGRPKGMARRVNQGMKLARKTSKTEGDSESRPSKKSSKSEYVDDLYDPATMTPVEFLQEHHPDAFDTQQDAHLYGGLMAKIAKIRSDAQEADAELAKARDPPEKERAQRRKEEIDNEVREALQDLQNAKDTVYPPHEPQTHSLEHFRGSVGEVPVGDAGMGAVVEDDLRHLGSQGWQWGWRDPNKLAQRLIDGEFVKFDSFTEKKEVIDLVRSKAAMQGEDGELKKVRFRPLREETRRSVVERLAGGQIEQGSRQQNPILRTVEDLTKGSVAPKARGTMLETVRDLMPKQKARARS
ncbi:MAG: hypothetical protein M1831_000878 [Alyxoria varia]|nr:MAG: hypothetical protein M1831_000878 [Alyxoria varia]